MGAFHYYAINPRGATIKGVIEADSEWHARQQLREQHLLPTEVVPVKKHTSIKSPGKLGAEDLCLFTRQLATLISAGIPLDEALTGVAEQTTKEKTRSLIISVRAKVMEGFSLANALAHFPDAFPDIYCATVEAGEQTGKLDTILLHLADYTERSQANKQRIIQALIYPLVMLMVSIGIIIFLLTYVVPRIIEVFSESGQTLPLLTVVLVKSSQFLSDYGLYLLGLIVIAIIGFKYAMKSTPFHTRIDSLLLKLPLIAKVSRLSNLSRYIHTFSMLFGAGVNVIETMKVSASVVNNRIMKEALSLATNKVQEGILIHQSLKETRFFPPMTLHLIASGEKSGALSGMMGRAASQLDDEVKRIIDTLLTLLEPFIILFMGVLVLFIVLATLLPIFSMEQLVN